MARRPEHTAGRDGGGAGGRGRATPGATGAMRRREGAGVSDELSRRECRVGSGEMGCLRCAMRRRQGRGWREGTGGAAVRMESARSTRPRTHARAHAHAHTLRAAHTLAAGPADARARGRGRGPGTAGELCPSENPGAVPVAESASGGAGRGMEPRALRRWCAGPEETLARPRPRGAAHSRRDEQRRAAVPSRGAGLSSSGRRATAARIGVFLVVVVVVVELGCWGAGVLVVAVAAVRWARGAARAAGGDVGGAYSTLSPMPVQAPPPTAPRYSPRAARPARRRASAPTLRPVIGDARRSCPVRPLAPGRETCRDVRRARALGCQRMLLCSGCGS